MTTTELLAQFANPATMHNLSVADKIIAGLITTVLGMGITFTALILLQFLISWMEKIINRAGQEPVVPPVTEKAAPAPVASVAPGTPLTSDDKQEDPGKLIAAITVALATQLGTSAGDIIIKNIRRIDHQTPVWNKAGIIDQMNSRQ
jgi:sodium pump decarboxylase gamma subunit